MRSGCQYHFGKNIRQCYMLIALWPTVAAAQETLEDLLTLSFDRLVDIPVVTATRSELPRSQAPAVISVITTEDIRQWGYRSVAEALQQVPGFYDVYDQVEHNVGVRGINSGFRGYSRGIKLLLDGQPINMRSDASSFLGPELIPMLMVDRIEVVRGPASALYGPDAFSGVINIITREPRPTTEAAVYVQQQQSAQLGAGLTVVHGGVSDKGSAMVGVSAARLNRSGQDLPISSPSYANLATAQPSAHDDAEPSNALLRMRQVHGRLENQVWLYSQHLQASGEFLDFGTLNHANWISLRQQGVRTQSTWRYNDDNQLQFYLSYAQGGPTSKEHLSLGSSASPIVRDFGFAVTEGGLNAEHRWQQQALSWGLDYSDDEEKLLQVYGLNATTQQLTLLSRPAGRQCFINQGAYVQYRWQPNDVWSYVLNARRDWHNRYGDTNNYRAAITVLPRADMTMKLLYGTSFKAPSALQLYAQPLYPGELAGNTNLQPETAKVWEGQLVWQLQPRSTLELTAFQQQVHNKIEFLPVLSNLRPENLGEKQGYGMEAEFRHRQAQQQWLAQVSWQSTEDINHHPFLGEIKTPTSSYPRLQTRVGWELPNSEWGGWAISGRYVSPRRATASNISQQLLQVYELGGYSSWRVHWRQRWHQHELQVTVDNLFNHRYAEAGYGGVDFPTSSRTITLGYDWRY